MSTIYAISGIIILLIALVGYALISQSIQRNRERIKRLVSTLKSRLRAFHFMLDGCPDGFLTKELALFVQRGLIDAYEQLTKLESNEPTHAQNLRKTTADVSKTQRQTNEAASEPLKSADQIREVKMSLEALQKYVFKQEELKRLARSQADAYRAQIKRLALRVAIESYELHGQKAKQSEKIKLALHYYELAYKLVLAEGKSSEFDAQKQKLQDKCTELKEQLLVETNEDDPVDNEAEEQVKEWDKFSDENEQGSWKKKQVYD